MRLKPHDYQFEAMDFMKSRYGSLLLLDCGMGKTISTLGAVMDLIGKGLVRRVLIVAPLRVARTTWPLEIDRWHQTCLLRYRVLHGKNKLDLQQEDADIHIINYEGLGWLADAVKGSPIQYDMIVWDEITRMKNPKSKRFKKARKLIEASTYRTGLTGTVLPKNYEDLWSQMFCIDKGERFDTSFWQWKNQWFEKADYLGYKWKPRAGAVQHFEEKMAEVSLAMRAEDHLDVPACEVVDHEWNLTKELRGHYRYMEKEMLIQLDDETITVPSAAVLTNKLLQFLSGNMYVEDEFGNKRVEHLHTVKEKALMSVLEGIDSPVLIAYSFRHEADRLAALLDGVEFMRSGMSKDKELDLQDRWNKGEVKYLACHPASAGHGLNLQHGGHHAIWYGLTWSLELYEQFNHRIDRQGQENETTIHRLVCSDTVDETVLSVLDIRATSQSDLIQAIRRRK